MILNEASHLLKKSIGKIHRHNLWLEAKHTVNLRSELASWWRGGKAVGRRWNVGGQGRHVKSEE